MRKLRQLLALFLLGLLSLAVQAQKNTITGKITDDKGEPVPFATISIKGTHRSVSADQNGNFTLDASKGAVLLISATGFGIRESTVHENGYSYALAGRNNNLQEVVVTALGIKRSKNSLPYATQQVSGDDLNRTPNTNFVDNLSGKVAGLQITSSNTTDGTNNVILRGFKSLTQSNQALFVVDGVPYDNTNQSQNGFDLGNAASDVNPEDIESISVLKGAAASALYGSRASNGVILINTKKGSHKGKGLGVTLSSGVTVGSPDKSTLPTYQTQYGEGYGSQGYSATYPNQSGFFYYTPTFTSNGQPVQVVQTDVDAATGPAYDPSIKVYNWDAFAPGDPNYGKATPWQPAAHHNPTDFFATPTTTINSVYVDGSGADGTFKAGYTHSVDKGLLPNNTITKNLFTLGASHNLNDQLTVGGTLNYSDAQGVGRDGYTYSSQQNPLMDFREWWPTNVNLKQQKADYFYAHNNESWNWQGDYADPSSLKVAYHNNIYWNRYQNSEDDERKRYFGNAYLNYKIAPFLSLLGRVSLDDYTQFVEYWTAVNSVHQAAYTRSNSSFNETNYDLLLNFDKKLSDNFSLKALLGTNVRQNTSNSILATTSGGLVVPGLYSLGNSVQTPPAPTEYDGRKEVDGVFAGGTLAYREFLTLDATIRRDRSSTLPSAHDTYYYPSVSGNFVFSRLLTLPWLSYGKIRANYAEVGGDAPIYSVQNTFQNVNPLNGQTLFAPSVTNNNANLLPEKNKSYEIGLEAAFLNSRLGFDVTYYHAKEINQITPVNVSTASGFSQFYVNGGAVQNQGVELTINASPVKTRDFSWDITVNWSKNINKILSLYGGQPSYQIGSYGFNTQLVAEVGKPYGIIRGSDYTYKNGQKLIDSNGYYVKNSNPLSDIGSVSPNWLGGITNSFRYQDWTLSFLIDVRQGGKVYSLDMDFGDYSGLYPETAGKNDLGNPVRSPLSAGGGLLLKGVTSDGKPNTKHIDASDINQGLFPFSSYNNFADASYVYDASYVKLRELALSYSVPKRALAGLAFIKGIDIALTGRNLWIIHKNLPYADPEQGYASLGSGTGVQNASQGFQVGVYPSVRTFGLNAKLKF
jgi:TonB-linked SusC/RagA family outer membrane protein